MVFGENAGMEVEMLGTTTTKTTAGESCVVCEQIKGLGIHLYTTFICEECKGYDRDGYERSQVQILLKAIKKNH